MKEFTDLRPAAKTYVAVVVFVGIATIGTSARTLFANPISTQWLILAALALLTGSFTVRVPSIRAQLSVSETFVFASVLLFGSAAGVITVALECLIINLWMRPRGRGSIHKILFNMAAPAIAIWAAGTTFFLLSGIEANSEYLSSLRQLFFPLLAFTVIYFLLNSWLVAVALGFESDQSPVDIWWNNFTWLSVNYFSGASVAALIVTYDREIDFSTLAIIVPLLVVLYLTFRTAMGRVEDTNKHLSELNQLYLSTIETLAMAIDAKDQITHGHIRRVQGYAVGLATNLGVVDHQLIKAIEAAALLHDMGKLAVPEYILNKPGKLSNAEFDKMKVHAAVGADILSAIAFPYPVVPIVRHHHENWDGSGYPAGLKGSDIPIGARILSVVDCFDALTSDRPYRPRLAGDEALRILVARRGTMYDPLIVDTFIRVHMDIAPESLPLALPRHALDEIAGSLQPIADPPGELRFDDIAGSSDEMLTLYELSRALGGQTSISDTGDVIAKHLRRLIPFAASVVFLYDNDRDELEAKHVLGDAASIIKGVRIPLGQRVSGWVAANRQTILNADATLDFGDGARLFVPRLKSCLSCPLLSDEQLVGVLSLYSATAEGFIDDHRRIIEAVARQIGHTFKWAADSDVAERRDAITGLPRLAQLEQLVRAMGLDNSGGSNHISLLFIDVVQLKQINDQYGRSVGDDALRHLVRRVREALRVTDILFRYGGDEFIAVVTDADPTAVEGVALNISDNLLRHPLLLESGNELKIEVNLTVAIAPRDGSSLEDLLAVGRPRLESDAQSGHGSSVH